MSKGHWRHGDVTYRDNLVRIVVDVPDEPENRQWMKAFKARWKKRLDQPAGVGRERFEQRLRPGRQIAMKNHLPIAIDKAHSDAQNAGPLPSLFHMEPRVRWR